jgi:drug/metabolite transporter (DMT)-like permease
MGEHSKADVTALGAVLGWLKANKKKVAAVAVAVVGVVTAVKPDFPGAVVLSALRAVLGG